MPNAEERAQASFDEEEFHFSSLIRMGSWGLGAAAALLLAVLAGTSDHGLSRAFNAYATLTGKTQAIAAAPQATAIPARMPEPQPNPETRRLAEQVRLLAADRDRVLHRLDVVERELDDVTGSIKRQQAATERKQLAAKPQAEPASDLPPPASIAAAAVPWPLTAGRASAEAPATTASVAQPMAPTEVATVAAPAEETASPLPEERPATITAKTAAVGPRQAPAATKPQANQHVALATAPSAAGRITYGVDLGGGASVERLRMLWNAVRAGQPAVLKNLHPIARVFQGKDGDRSEMRLIAGPLASTEQANRLCSTLLDSGHFCETAIFRGRQLR